VTAHQPESPPGAPGLHHSPAGPPTAPPNDHRTPNPAEPVTIGPADLEETHDRAFTQAQLEQLFAAGWTSELFAEFWACCSAAR
jgi:hypothetical protein